jgi:uncharacterized protein (DUF58 family)
MLFPKFHDLVNLRGHRYRSISKINASSIYSGDARSHNLGQGMEFAKVRPYEVGDDVRSIDWKVTARTNKAHSKIYHAQSDNVTTIILDLNERMQFGTQNTFRNIVAAQAFAIIGFSTLSAHNRVATLLFGQDEKPKWFPPTKLEAGFLKSLKTLSAPIDYSNHDEYSLSSTLDLHKAVIRKSQSIYIISDPYSYTEEVLNKIGPLSLRSKCTIIDIQDPIDATMPRFDNVNFVHENNTVRINGVSNRYITEYENQWQNLNDSISRFCQRKNIKRISLHTDEKDIQLLRKRLANSISTSEYR